MNFMLHIFHTNHATAARCCTICWGCVVTRHTQLNNRKPGFCSICLLFHRYSTGLGKVIQNLISGYNWSAFNRLSALSVAQPTVSRNWRKVKIQMLTWKNTQWHLSWPTKSLANKLHTVYTSFRKPVHLHQTHLYTGSGSDLLKFIRGNFNTIQVITRHWGTIYHKKSYIHSPSHLCKLTTESSSSAHIGRIEFYYDENACKLYIFKHQWTTTSILSEHTTTDLLDTEDGVGWIWSYSWTHVRQQLFGILANVGHDGNLQQLRESIQRRPYHTDKLVVRWRQVQWYLST